MPCKVEVLVNGKWYVTFAGTEKARPTAKAMYKWYVAHGYYGSHIAQIS